MQRWVFQEGIDSVCNSIEEILSNQNIFSIVYKFDYLIFDFKFFRIKIHFLFFLLMHKYSEENSLYKRIKKYIECNLKKNSWLSSVKK
jgi:hypothetical protein